MSAFVQKQLYTIYRDLHLTKLTGIVRPVELVLAPASLDRSWTMRMLVDNVHGAFCSVWTVVFF